MRDIISEEEVSNYFFEQGFDCSQVVFASVCEELGMDQETISAKAKEFESKFREKNKSIICREILGYDIGKPDEFEKAISK